MYTTLTLREIRETSRILYHLTQIPVICRKGPELLFTYPDLDGMEFLTLPFCEDNQPTQKNCQLPAFYGEHPGFFYAGFAFENKEGNFHFFAGPCLSSQLSLKELQHIFPKLKKQNPKVLFSLLTALPLQEPEYLCDFLSLIYSLFFQIRISSGKIQETIQTEDYESIPKNTQETLFHQRENSHFHTPYSCEKKMLDAVQRGDLAHIQERLSDLNLTGKPGILSQDPLRHNQNLFVSCITQITRAAINGGVPENKAYAMSDSYIQASEKCKTVASLSPLQEKAAFEFTAAVAEYGKHKGSSPAIRRAVNYLFSHQHEKITLADTAAIAGLSPGRFAHLFKEETGVSPMEYLNRERIDTARHLLSDSGYSISEISNFLTFSSESHFISVFKKHTGMTPKKYRDSF
ncbi:MAG: helix-turn-helix domain-containing protein [Blautia sp.]